MILCVRVPAFRLAVMLQERGALRCAMLADKRERGHIIEATRDARRLGVRFGMTTVQAQAAVPEAVTVVNDEQRCVAVWTQILDALDALSPLVEDAGPGRAYAEMHGIAGAPAQWCATARRALAGFNLPFRFGVAANKFAAFAATTIEREYFCEPGEEAAMLAPLSIHLLDCEPAVLEQLRLLGIRTLGALCALPHGPLVRRFGPAAARWHDVARGIDEQLIVPRNRSASIERAAFGEGSAEHEEAVLFALRVLLESVAGDLTRAGKSCGALCLRIECEDAQTSDFTVSVAQPSASATMLFNLMRTRLEGATFTSPVVGLRVGAQGLEEIGTPAVLFAQHDPDPQAVDLALVRLQSILGDGKAVRARIVDGHRPEARYVYEPFHYRALQQTAAANAEPKVQYRLCEPHAIDVVTNGTAPAFVGTPPQTVVRFAGPWRRNESWFSTPIARDDYDVLLEDGALYRISHEAGDWSVQAVYD